MGDLRFGFATHFEQGWNTNLMPLIAATGVGYIRDDLLTSRWEPTVGNFVVPATDKTWLDLAHANGLLVVGIIGKNTTYPSGDPYDPQLMANRAAFIAASGLVDVIEVTNEPNNDFQTTEGAATWEAKLAALTTACTNAVHAAAPGVQVIGLGAQGNQIISILGSTTVDGIVYHPYDNDNQTVGTFIPETVFEGSFTNYEGWLGNIMAATNLPLWETEWGIQTVTGFSQDNQASYLVRRMLIAVALGVDHTFIYEFKDNNSTDLYGVYDQAGTTAKSSYAVVTNLISALQGVVGNKSGAVPASSGFVNRTFGVTFNSVASGNTAQAYGYIIQGDGNNHKTVVATWFGNTSPTNPPVASTASITCTANTPFSIAASTVYDPVANTSVPLSTYTASVSGNTLTVTNLPISNHPLLIILMPTAHFVRATASGLANGTSWTNAWSMATLCPPSTGTQPASIAAGDVVWIAGGNYGANGFFLTKNGTSAAPITYKRVTAADQAANNWADYQTAFDSQVFFNNGGIGHTFACSFVTVDGQAGFTSANRFKDGFLSGPQTGNQGTMLAWGAINGSNVNMNTFSLKFFAMVGFYQNQANHVSDAAGYGLNSVNSEGTKTNILFQNCSVRGFCETLRIYDIQAGGNVTYDNCYIADTYDDGRDHEDICYTASPIGALTVTNCVFNNSPNDGWFFESGSYSNVTFSGNFFYGCGTVFAESKSDSTFINMVVTNNIFAAPPSLAGTGMLFNAGTGHGTVSGTSRFQNNILINADHDFSNPSSVCDHNAYSNSGTPSGETGSFTFTYSAHFIKLPVTNLDGSVAGGHGSSPDGVLGGGPQAQGDATGDAHLTAAGIALFKNKGANLSNTATAVLNVDPDGTLRGSTGTWSIGVFEPAGAAAPAPTVPTGLATSAPTSTKMTLTWLTSTDAPNTNQSLTYNLQRKTGAGSFATVATGIAGVASGNVSFTDTGLAPSTAYVYNVQAVNPAGLTSAFSTTNATGTTTAAAPAPSVPTGLVTGAVTSNTVVLTWNTSTDAPDTNASLTYKIQRKLGTGAFATLPAVVPGVASGTITFTDSGLAPSSTYTYNVQAVNPEGLSSAFSTTNATATTAAAPAIPVFVQTANSGVPTGTTTTASATYPAAQAAGNLNVVVVSYGSGTTTITPVVSLVTDSNNGNIYTLGVPFKSFIPVSGGGSLGQSIFYSVGGTAAGANTVTVTLNGSVNFFTITIYEYAGVALASPVDVTASTSAASGTAISSGSATTTLGNDLIFGSVSCWDAPPTLGAGFTSRQSYFVILGEDKINPGPSAVAVTATDSGSQGFVAQMIAFKAAAVVLQKPLGGFAQVRANHHAVLTRGAGAFGGRLQVNDHSVITANNRGALLVRKLLKSTATDALTANNFATLTRTAGGLGGKLQGVCEVDMTTTAALTRGAGAFGGTLKVNDHSVITANNFATLTRGAGAFGGTLKVNEPTLMTATNSANLIARKVLRVTALDIITAANHANLFTTFPVGGTCIVNTAITATLTVKAGGMRAVCTVHAANTGTLEFYLAQSNAADFTGGSQSTLTVPYTSGQSSGNANIVCVVWINGPANSSCSVTDDAGNFYVQLNRQDLSGFASTTSRMNAFWCEGIAASAAGNNVKATFSGNVVTAAMIIAEYAGINDTVVDAVTTKALGTSVTPSVNVTTVQPKDILVSFVFGNNFSYRTPNGAWALQELSPLGILAMQDELSGAPGVYNSSATLSPSSSWSIFLSPFRTLAVIRLTSTGKVQAANSGKLSVRRLFAATCVISGNNSATLTRGAGTAGGTLVGTDTVHAANSAGLLAPKGLTASDLTVAHITAALTRGAGAFGGTLKVNDHSVITANNFGSLRVVKLLIGQNNPVDANNFATLTRLAGGLGGVLQGVDTVQAANAGTLRVRVMLAATLTVRANHSAALTVISPARALVGQNNPVDAANSATLLVIKPLACFNHSPQGAIFPTLTRGAGAFGGTLKVNEPTLITANITARITVSKRITGTCNPQGSISATLNRTAGGLGGVLIGVDTVHAASSANLIVRKLLRVNEPTLITAANSANLTVTHATIALVGSNNPVDANNSARLLVIKPLKVTALDAITAANSAALTRSSGALGGALTGLGQMHAHITARLTRTGGIGGGLLAGTCDVDLNAFIGLTVVKPMKAKCQMQMNITAGIPIIFSGATNACVNLLLNLLLRGVTGTFPTTLWLGLLTTRPQDDIGHQGTELTALQVAGYGRLAIPVTAFSWTSLQNGRCLNAIPLNFNPPAGGGHDVTQWGIYDAQTSGTLLFWGDLNPKQTILAGFGYGFGVGSLTVKGQ